MVADQPRAFIAMPFGVRQDPLDHEGGSPLIEINFDSVWKDVLRPGIPDEFETMRADESRRTGLIERDYIEWLFNAEIVLADLTFGNPNVYYELGIRQALRPKGTVLVACEGSVLPFDVRNQKVYNYPYPDSKGLESFHQQLREVILQDEMQSIESPVHLFLPGLSVSLHDEEEIRTELLKRLDAKEQEDRLLAKIRDAPERGRLIALHAQVVKLERPSATLIERLAVELRRNDLVEEAISLLKQAVEVFPQDPELLRELGFSYRLKGSSHFDDADQLFRRALEVNDRDPELLGMIGGLRRRNRDYEGALVYYERALGIDPSSRYAQITVAALTGALGQTIDAAEQYRRIRADCEKQRDGGNHDYWMYLNLGEACAVLGDVQAASEAFDAAVEHGAAVGDRRSAASQLQFLQSRGVSRDAIDRVVHEAFADLL